MDFNLNSKEFIFLCYTVGAKQVCGIKDPFESIVDGNIHSEIRKTHLSLENKNYIDSDFNGNSTIDENLIKLIQCCTGFSSMVIFNCSKDNCVETINYYFDSNFAVKMVKNGDDYLLKQFDKKIFVDEIISNLFFRSGKESVQSAKTVILQSELFQLKKQLQQSKKTEVLNILTSKMDELTASKFISALEEKEDFYSIAVVDAVNLDNGFNGIMIIDTDEGALMLETCVERNENAVSITACSRKEIETLVKDTIWKTVRNVE